jgi:hypothetical protein
VLPAVRAHHAARVAVPLRAPHGGGRWYAGPEASFVAKAAGRPIYKAHLSAPARGADYRVKPVHDGRTVSPARTPAVKAPRVAPAAGPVRKPRAIAPSRKMPPPPRVDRTSPARPPVARPPAHAPRPAAPPATPRAAKGRPPAAAHPRAHPGK